MFTDPDIMSRPLGKDLFGTNKILQHRRIRASQRNRFAELTHPIAEVAAARQVSDAQHWEGKLQWFTAHVDASNFIARIGRQGLSVDIIGNRHVLNDRGSRELWSTAGNAATATAKLTTVRAIHGMANLVAGSGGPHPVKGDLLKIEGEFYTVHDTAGHEVRLHVDKTTKLEGAFKAGDKVAAQVTNESHVLSMRHATPAK